jgi:hypothetical protein
MISRRTPAFRSATVLLASAALLLAVACEKAPPPAVNTSASATAPDQPAAAAQPEAAEIQKAVETYVQTVRNVDVSKMTITVKDLKVEGDKATCAITYGYKADPSVPPMAYQYELERKDGAWTVASSRPEGSEGHAGAMAMPPGHPGTESMPAHGAEGQMPAGHPPVTTPEPSK